MATLLEDVKALAQKPPYSLNDQEAEQLAKEIVDIIKGMLGGTSGIQPQDQGSTYPVLPQLVIPFELHISPEGQVAFVRTDPKQTG